MGNLVNAIATPQFAVRGRSSPLRGGGVLAVVIVAQTFAVAAAHASTPPDWPIAGLAERLGSPQRDPTPTLSVTWRETPLRQVIEGLSASLGEPIWIDRRIDPATRVSLRAEATPDRLLQLVAAEIGAATDQLAGVAYLGPIEPSELRTLHARALLQVEALPRDRRRAFARRADLAWPRLSTPREVLGKLAEAAGLELEGSQLVPHDLLSAKALPGAPLHEQLSLMLAGFGLDWRPSDDRRGVEVIPIERPVVIAAAHRVADRNRWKSTEIPEEFQSAAKRGNRLLFTGSVDQHERLADFLAGRTRAGPAPSSAPKFDRELANKRFTLTVKEKPAEVVLKTLANSLKLEIVDQTMRRDWRETRVSLAVREADIGALLEEIGTQASVGLRIKGAKLVVESKP